MTDNCFEWPVRVYYEDTDSGGVVYHANYLHFMERARTEWLRSLQLEQDVLRENYRILFAVTSLSIDYRQAAVFNDLLLIQSQIIKFGRASLVFDQQICRQADKQVLTSAQVKVACIAADGRKKAVPIPQQVYQMLQSLHDKSV